MRVGAAGILRPIGGDEDALDGAGEAVVFAEQDSLHQRGESSVLNGCRQWNTGVGREVPNGASETEAINQVQSNRHLSRIDRHYLVVHFGIVDVAVWKLDVIGFHAERYHGGIVD